MSAWNWIHDFFHGFGYEEQIPDNEEVIERHDDAEIPYTVVRTKVTPRIIWVRDIGRLLPAWITVDETQGEKLELIHAALVSLLQLEHQQFPPPPFKIPDKFTVPRFSKAATFPDIRQILSDNLIREAM